MEQEALISRAEVAAMLFTLADINQNVDRIKNLLEAGYGEEEDPEDDS